LIILPLYIVHVFCFLNKDFRENSAREKPLISELLGEVGGRLPSFTGRLEEFIVVPDRSTLPYFILTLTTGLFMVYWVYTLTKDSNQRFESHSILENEIITAFKQILSRTMNNFHPLHYLYLVFPSLFIPSVPK